MPFLSQPLLTPLTYQAYYQIAAAPLTTADLAAALHLSPLSAGRRVAQLRALKLVESTGPRQAQTHHLTTLGRTFLTPDD